MRLRRNQALNIDKEDAGSVAREEKLLPDDAKKISNIPVLGKRKGNVGAGGWHNKYLCKSDLGERPRFMSIYSVFKLVLFD